MFRFVTSLLLALALCVPASPLHGAEKKVVRVSTGQSHDPRHIAFMEFLKPWLEERLGDRYTIEVYADNALGTYDTVFQGTVLNSIQISMSTADLYSQFVPELGVMNMPYAFDTPEQVYTFIDSDFFDEYNGYCRKRGVELLSLTFSSFRVFQFNKPVKTVEEMRNIKFRTTSNKFHVATINSFGMAATPMAPSEVLTALTQGVLGGADGDNYSPIHYRWSEGAPYIVFGDHMAQIYVWCASSSWMKSLPEEDRAIFTEGFRLYMDYMRAKQEELNRFDVVEAALKAHGCEVYVLPETERAKLKQASLVVYDKLPANLREIADRIRSFVSQTPQSHS